MGELLSAVTKNQNNNLELPKLIGWIKKQIQKNAFDDLLRSF